MSPTSYQTAPPRGGLMTIAAHPPNGNLLPTRRSTPECRPLPVCGVSRPRDGGTEHLDVGVHDVAADAQHRGVSLDGQPDDRSALIKAAMHARRALPSES